MSRWTLRVACLLLPWVSVLGASAGPATDPRFFAFDNGVGRGAGWTPERQAAVLARLGYGGIGYTGVQDLAARQAAFAARGLRVVSVYVGAWVDRAEPFEPALRAALPALGRDGILVWLTLQGKAPDDTRAVAIVRELADAGQAAGVRIALYPHKGFFVATAEEARRIVRAVDRPNVGLTFNLAHELAAGNARRLPEVIRACAPHLFLASINGADPEGDWSRLIRPLDEGTVEVGEIVRELAAAGYRGPIGLQCYNIPGDPEVLLARSRAAWGRLGN